MKKLLLWLMIIYNAGIIASYQNLNEVSIAVSQANLKLLRTQLGDEKNNGREALSREQSIRKEMLKEEEILEKLLKEKKIKEVSSKLEKEIDILERALYFTANQKCKLKVSGEVYDYGDGESPIHVLCGPLYTFQSRLAKRNLMAEKLMDAFEGIDNQQTTVSCCRKTFMCAKSLACCFFCYPSYEFSQSKFCLRIDCCRDYAESRKAKYFVDGLEVLGQKKLRELQLQRKPEETLTQTKLTPVEIFTMSDRIIVEG